MRNLYLNRAISEGVAKEMEKDKSILLIGEDMLNRGGGLSIFMGCQTAYPDQVYDMPIAECGFSNFGVGLAMGGHKVIVDLMFSDFSTLAADPIINSAAKISFNSLGKTSCSMVFTMGNGGRGTYDGVGSGVNHSQCVEAWYMNVPGLKIVMPYYPSDALGLMRSSIRDKDPVIFLYHEGSLGTREECEDEIDAIPLTNAAKVMTEGNDITIIALQSMVPLAVEAVAELKEKGINAELIDPRVIVPLDTDKLVQSAKKTKKVLVVQEAPSRGGIGGEIISQIAQRCAKDLEGVDVLGALNAPIGSGFSEAYIMPHTKDIIERATALVK